MKRVPVQTSTLRANQETASENRALFEAEGLLVINLMSSPGAGKTTMLEKTIRCMRGGFRVGVIEGDLQTDLDAQRMRALGVPSHQITTGSVSHLDARMIARALIEFPLQELDVLVIENVGNLICPASVDLGEGLRVVLCSVSEGADKPKKYPVMFHNADVVLVNKTDLAQPSGVNLRELRTNIRQVNPSAIIFALSCRTGEGFEAWLDWLQHAVVTRSSAAFVRQVSSAFAR